MGVFLGILYALQIIVSILLILIVLMQRTSKEGLGLAFGSSMGETVFGSRAGNVLIKITTYLAAFFLGNTLLIAKLQTGASRSVAARTAPAVPPAATAGEQTSVLPVAPPEAETPAPAGAADAAAGTAAPEAAPISQTPAAEVVAPQAPEPAPAGDTSAAPPAPVEPAGAPAAAEPAAVEPAGSQAAPAPASPPPGEPAAP